jgi:hypothetical protein
VFESTDWPTTAEWQADIERMKRLVDRIQSRGGKVVFLRQPSSGEVRALEDKYFPRAKYWDVFANSVGAESIHCDDLPGMAELACPDGSHLEYRDAVIATNAIVSELRRRGVIE